MLPGALKLLSLLWGQLVLLGKRLGVIQPHWLVAVDATASLLFESDRCEGF